MDDYSECSYCGFTGFQSQCGLHSHISQTKECREARDRYSQLAYITQPPIQPGSPESNHSLSTSSSSDDEEMLLGSTRNFSPPSYEASSIDNPPDLEASPSRPSKHAHIEEVKDEEAGGIPKKAWIKDYPAMKAGSLLRGEDGKERRAKMAFDLMHEACTKPQKVKDRKSAGSKEGQSPSPWFPFENWEEWELGSWLLKSGLSQSAIDKYLKLPIVHYSLVFMSIYSFSMALDT